MTSAVPPILYEAREATGVVTLNRPRAFNALDLAMADALNALLGKIESDRALRCVVLRGAGDAFMAGGDLRYIAAAQDDRRGRLDTLIRSFHSVILRLAALDRPVIAAVHGAVAGAGLSLMLACDLAVAARGARFSSAYIRLGATPDGGLTHHLPVALGHRDAFELVALSPTFSAEQAATRRLVNWVVDESSLEEESLALARQLADGPAEALAATKRLLRGDLSTLEAQLDRERESFLERAGSDEFEEGVQAFLGKRRADFRRGSR